jgi:hypothetical protein
LEKTITLVTPEYGARREIVARQIEDIDFDFASARYFDAKNAQLQEVRRKTMARINRSL